MGAIVESDDELLHLPFLSRNALPEVIYARISYRINPSQVVPTAMPFFPPFNDAPLEHI